MALRHISRVKLVAIAFGLAMAGVAARAAFVIVHVAATRGAARDATVPRAPATAPGTAATLVGATGTASLPALPIPATVAEALAADDTIHPAPPFSLHRASVLDQGRALNCLATAIYYEAASESDAGQRAVGQVILNRVRHPAFPATVCGVVYQGSEHAGCQFSFACDGAMSRPPARAPWARALHNAALMLGGAVEPEVGTATHYHSYAVTPAWNRQMVMTAAIGAHFFHRWQGYWGTLAALSQPYAGGEPPPGPHAPAMPLPPSLFAATLPPPAAPASVQLPPAPAEPSLAGPVPPRDDRLPDSPVLDKWKDSGKPLR